MVNLIFTEQSQIEEDECSLELFPAVLPNILYPPRRTQKDFPPRLRDHQG